MDLFPAESDHKFDRRAVRCGPFVLVANLQHPPLTRRYAVLNTIALLLGFALVGCALFASTLLVHSGWKWTGRFIGVTLNLLYLLMVLPMVLTVARLSRRIEERAMRELEPLHMSGSPPAASRVFVRGRPTELLQFANLTDALFEPQFFGTRHWLIVRRIDMRIIGIISAWTVAAIIIWTGTWRTPRSLTFLLVALPLVTYMLTLGIPRRPVYYRVTPGRMIVSFTAGSERNRCASIVMTSARRASTST